MTQGSQGELPSDLEMERSMGNPDFEDAAESMEDDQDSEVRNNHSLYSFSVYCGTQHFHKMQVIQITFLISYIFP